MYVSVDHGAIDKFDLVSIRKYLMINNNIQDF